MSLQITRQRLNSARSRIEKFIDLHITRWVKEEILESIHESMRVRGFSDNAINALTVEKTGYMKASLIWDYRGPNNEPIHFFIEFQTHPHIIKAKGRLFGGADALHWVDKTGNNVFAKKVKHPGTTGQFIVTNGYKENRNKLIARIKQETENYMMVEQIG